MKGLNAVILFRAGNAGGQPRTQTTEDKLIMITITTVTGKRAINQRTDAGTFFQRTIKQKFKLRNNPDMQNLAQAVAQELTIEVTSGRGVWIEEIEMVER